ncbi:hypothetical protein BV25DRAFT_3176 [Artomyces pyxidatus]|uniref:Uncharacterized protein n=1 Tax=Artomyces pyxidatus TaxID=48021 RepID=A0ACB8TJA5_9AGAM|nr:hypothetical protein BV25DRAFT_3176 [Artomyces pyxidatus]
MKTKLARSKVHEDWGLECRTQRWRWRSERELGGNLAGSTGRSLRAVCRMCRGEHQPPLPLPACRPQDRLFFCLPPENPIVSPTDSMLESLISQASYCRCPFTEAGKHCLGIRDSN